MRTNIPKIIHQTWKTKKIPEKLKFCVNSWKKYNPEYTYMFWEDKDIDIFIKKKYPQYIDIYSKLKQGIQIADLFRILILHYYGGIYADIDFECLRPIDLWNINHSKINIAFEPKEHHNIDVLCNALIISPKNVNIMLEIIEHGKRIIKKSKREVMNLFGPIAWTNVLNQNPIINILDRNLIYPIPDITANKALKNKYLTKILKRDFGNSWAVHYWHHSNWPRHNILDKYYNFLLPKKDLKSISICGLYRNNSAYLKEYLIPKLEKLEKLYSNIKFYYYFYQNDSIDATDEILSKFSINRECKFLTEINNIKLFKRNTEKKE